MRKIRRLVGLFLILFAVQMPSTTQAMVDPEIIQWQAGGDEFLNSVYLAVFGRYPNQNDINQTQQFKGKMELFLSLIDSNEYEQMYGYLVATHTIYWDARYIEGDETAGYCNCYYFAENAQGFAPDIQHTGVSIPNRKFNFPVARALTLMCGAFDKNTCQLFECGKTLSESDEASSATSQSGGMNLVGDPNFASFGLLHGPWGCDGTLGIWWGEAECAVGTVTLENEIAPTALYIVNQSPRQGSIYGTTGQRIAVTAGRTYEVSFYAQARDLASRGGVNIAIDGLWEIRPVKLDAGTYQWKKFTGTFEAPTAEVELRILCEDQGEVWITNMTLIER